VIEDPFIMVWLRRGAAALLVGCWLVPASGQRAAKSDTVKVTIKKLMPPLNTGFNDFAPVVSADGGTLMFTSNRPATEREMAKGKAGREYIYQVTMDPKKKKWDAPQLLGAAVNAPGRNNSAIALSPDGQRMLVYRDNNDGNGNIFESVLHGTEWSELIEFPEPINSDEHESSACYSPDGRTIYFVSDRKGGAGGKDIWFATRTDNYTWGPLMNMGPSINTPEDEQGIFLQADGHTMYFSSKGHGSTGGYDLFVSTFGSEVWSTPKNLGAPLNTPGDDLYLVLLADGRTAYMSSERSGGMGEKDLYDVKFTPIAGRKNQDPLLTMLKGIVVDEETKAPVESDIEITDNAKNALFSRQRSNSSTGNFLLSLPSGGNYGISVSALGYLFHSENFTLNDTAGYKEVVKVIEMKRLKAGKTIVLNNVFYDFDKATLRVESTKELDALVELLNDNPGLRIELGSHTDDKGANDHNQRLSEERATSVVVYLVGKGIAQDRLVPKGYGEASPAATNDTDEGRQKNRRTEFKVLE
jgi:outer membrane protein OmpA-like peptidoglycan-associated protein